MSQQENSCEGLPVQKKDDKTGWVIGGSTLAGLGVGLIFVQESALIFTAAILIGIGAGLLLAPFVPKH